MTAARATDWRYLAREAVLILLWAYVLLVGGTVNGLIAFRVHLATTILAAVVLGAWLIGRWRAGRLIPRTGLEWAALVFVGAQCAAALLSQDVRRSVPVVVQTISYWLVFCLAFDLTRAGWPAELTEKALLVVGGIVLGLGLLDVLQVWLRWLALAAGQTYAPDFQYRLYAPLGDANLLAACVNVLLPLAAARALASPARLPRLALGVWSAAALAVQAFTSSRGGQLGLLAALGALIVLWPAFVSPAAAARARRAWSALRARPVVLALLGLVVLAAFGAFAARALFLRTATQGPALFARQEFWPAAVAAFGESPLWGKGPGVYPSEFMRANSVPPQRPFLHAHSVPLNLAAEAGLLGLGAAALMVGAGAVALWRARGVAAVDAMDGAAYHRRARWAAVAAAWAGFLTHSLVDDHTRYLAAALPLIVMLAAVLAEPPGGAIENGPGLRPLVLFLPALAVGGFALYALRAEALAEQSIEAAGAGDWARAARFMDQAAEADPALALYWQQAGYAHGRLAADPAELTRAIGCLERGADLEPRYAVPRANLAALYWQSGRREEATAAMRRAVELAPSSSFLWLNVGLYEEAQGRTEAAEAAFRAALDLNPGQADAGFWTATALRAAAREAWRAARPAESQTLRERVQGLLADGRADEAERLLAEAWRQDRQRLDVYSGLAEVARARGDLEAAARYVESALWVQTVQVGEQINALLLAAEIDRARGREAEAVGRYQAVLNAVTDYGSLGWGSAGWTPHAFFVFQRRGLPLDVLPQVVRADFTPALGLRLLPLGELYEARGEVERAAEVYRRLLAADPAFEAARQRLDVLPAP